MKFFRLVLPVMVVLALLVSGCNSGVTSIKSGVAATVNPSSSLVTLSPVPMPSPSAQPSTITMNFKQIQAGNYSSLQGTWKEVAYAENVYDGKGVQWKKGLPASSATLSVSSDKIVYNGLVIIQGSTLTVTIDNGDPAGSHPLEFFIDNDGSLSATLEDADKVAINWGVYFYPKGVKNDLEPNNGAKIDNTKNLIVIWTSNRGYTAVFAQTIAKSK